MSSFDEGYKFGVGIILAVMEMEVIDAEVELEFGREENKEYDEKNLNKKKVALERYKNREVKRLADAMVNLTSR